LTSRKAIPIPMGIPDGDDELDALDIKTICARTGLGRTFVYAEIRRGALCARKFGRLTRILRRDYRAWLAAALPIAPVPPSDAAARGPTAVRETHPASGEVRDDLLSKHVAPINNSTIRHTGGPPLNPTKRLGARPDAQR
jgi:excisionase family DNA binding protein